MKKSMNVMVERKKIQCEKCGKMVSSANIIKHQKTKKCLNRANDKTTGKNNVTITSPAVGSVFPTAPVESHSKILTEINMNKEFENMAEKFKGKTDEDKEKKYKYKCGECGEYFNLPAAGDKCPFCGV